MNRNATLLFVTAAIVSLGGCTGRIIIGPNPTPSTLARANQVLAGEVEGVADDGIRFRARGVRLSADSVFLGTAAIDGARVVPRTRLVHLTTGMRRGRGTLRGALFGAGGGAILGALAGCRDSSSDFRCEGPADAAMLFGWFGLMGGAMIGAITGSRTELILLP